MNPIFRRASSVALGSVTNVFTDRPWRSKTVRFALLVAVIGMAFWLRHAFRGAPVSSGDAGGTGLRFDHPIPGYVRVAVSYIGGFLIGWTFRRFVKIIFLIAISIIALLGVARFEGCDTTRVRQQIEHDAEAAKEKAGHERDHLKGLLPSSTAAGIGAFWGFWRRSRGLATAMPQNMAAGASSPPKVP